MFLPKTNGAGLVSIIAYKIISKGGYNQFSVSPSLSATFAPGDILMLEIIANGTVIECRAWKSTDTKPTSATITANDSSFASGNIGFYRSIAGSSVQSAFDDVLYENNVAATRPAAPTIGTATAGNTTASVPYTVTDNGGSMITGATATASTGETATGTSSPISFTGLSNGVARTFTVVVTNAIGTSDPSATSNSVTPAAGASVPGAPTIGTAVAGNGYVDVAFTAPASDGGSSILDYTALLSTGEAATGTTSPIRVTAANGTARTATVRARNGVGTGAASSASNSVTPMAPTGTIYPPDNANIVFSPGNWYSNGAGAMQANNAKAGSTFAWSNMRGSYLKFKVVATSSIALALNTASLASVNAAGCPQIAWSVNGAAPQSQTLTSGQTSLVLATGLGAASQYEVFVWFRGVYITQDGDVAANYTTPNNRFQITGVAVDVGGSLAMPTVKPYRQFSFGDSITEGDLSNGGPRSATSQDAGLVYPWYLSEALNAEVGIIGFYGQTWSWFNASWSNYAGGFSRLTSGAFQVTPDIITVNYGENDGSPGPTTANIALTLNAISAAAPNAKMFVFVPFSGRARTNLSAATLPANCRLVDLNRYEMKSGSTQWSYDGQHPNAKGHANLGALAAGAIAPLMAGLTTGLTTRTVTMTLRDSADALAANLSSIQVSVFDDPTRPAGGVIRYQSATATTNSAGVLTLTYQSSLAAGGVCGVDLILPDKSNMAVNVAVT